MGKVTIGYKAFDLNFTCRDFQYEVGKTYELEGKLEICQNGFHFCKNLIDCFEYYSANSRIAEVIALGEVITEDKKSCTDKIYILRELSREEIFQKANVGIRNTGIANEGDYNSGFENKGNCNSGRKNIGSWNSGSENTGSCNSGSENKGNYNSGQENIGNWNSGYKNRGDYNTGDDNIGDYNSGDLNIGCYNCGENNRGDSNTGSYNYGDYNSGNRNVGIYNSGDANIGNYNIGDFNKGNYCLGVLNTKIENRYIYLFNKESNLTFDDWKEHKAKKILSDLYIISDNDGNKQNAWEQLSQSNKEVVLNLPNFDAAIFKEITGIDVNFKDTIEKLVSNT